MLPPKPIEFLGSSRRAPRGLSRRGEAHGRISTRSCTARNGAGRLEAPAYSRTGSPRMTKRSRFASVWDAIEKPKDAASLKARAEVALALIEEIERRSLTQSRVAAL